MYVVTAQEKDLVLAHTRVTYFRAHIVCDTYTYMLVVECMHLLTIAWKYYYKYEGNFEGMHMVDIQSDGEEVNRDCILLKVSPLLLAIIYIAFNICIMVNH